jgi:hypothetical protein
MSVSPNLQIAIDHAQRGRPVAPSCPPDAEGRCHCGGKWNDATKAMVPHGPKEVGKAPIGRLVKHGISDATTNTSTIDRWWRAMPDANINVELQASRWLVIDTDSPDVEAAAISRGLDGGVVRESRNRAYVFERPKDCPVVNLIKADGDPLDILTLGNFVVHGTHQMGCPVRLDPTAKPGPAPAWAVEMVKAKAAEKSAQEATTAARRADRAAQYGSGGEPPVRLHQRGLQRWTGDRFEASQSGKLDRDLSLFFLGLDLAECGATESTITRALEERDEALGWRKFTGRGDAERRYTEIAEKAVARAIERAKSSQPAATAPGFDATVAELRAALEERDAHIMRLQRALLDRDDRLEILEPIVNQIDAIIQRPDEELSSDDKVVDIGLIRWLPYHQAKREAKGEPPSIALGYLSKVIGMPKKRISKSLERQSSKDPDAGAPFRKHVTRRYLEDEQRWESSMEVQPWGATPLATLRAAATYLPPVRPKRGGSKEASDARWGRCDKHDNDVVRVKGFCPDCGKVVGERMMRVEEFDMLNVQLGHSEGTAPPCVEDVLIEVHLGHSDVVAADMRSLNVRVVDSEARPVSLLDYVARREPAPVKCLCGCMEYAKQPDGWRCLKCSTVYDPPLVASAGGAE